MEGNKGKQAESPRIEEILREHDRLEQVIQKEFRKQATILFTDICGYTQYMDARGDIKGRGMLQKHNDILLPLIEKYNGMVIKTIGDAVMATFESPSDAVRASVGIQNRLHEHNCNAEDEIHVKIGINTGNVLTDESDVFGDAVNVAARIQSKAGKDEILISENLFDRICSSGDFFCRFYSSAKLKGKPEPVKLYQVIWKEDDQESETRHQTSNQQPATGNRQPATGNRQPATNNQQPATSNQQPSTSNQQSITSSQQPATSNQQSITINQQPATSKQQPAKMFHLEVSRVQDHLKISAYEQLAGEAGTVRHYEEIPVNMDTISTRCCEMAETLNKTNRQGRVSPDILVKLREIGQVFFDDLLTHDVKEKIRETKTGHLVLNLDDTLVHVPWELLYDGNQFLCQRFSMGRLVRTRQNVPGRGKSRDLSGPLNMMILADPGGDLNGAYSEGIQLRDYIDQNSDFIRVSLRADNISSDFVREKIRNFDFVHYAGHSDYDRENPGESGWRLSTGRFRAQEIMKMAGTGVMPSLIFSNACQSARTEGWEIKESFHDEIFGLANAFVLAGVKHYVGTFWEILDEPSRRFALEFYKHLFSGVSVGEAMQHARLMVIREYGEETIVWASYLLYGDPAFNYTEQIQKREAQDRESPEMLRKKTQHSVSMSDPKIRATEETPDFSGARPRKRKLRWKRVAGAVLVFVLLVLWGYPGILRKNSPGYGAEALAYYNAGNFEEALNACKAIENKNPQVRLTYLIQGDIYLRQGNPDSACSAYQKALQAPEGTDQEKADALVGLGRVASVRKQTDEALKYYRQASETAPASGSGYLAQAMLVNREGNYKEALDLFDRAGEFSPDNDLLASVTKETRRKFRVLQDQEKQERISRLVRELLETMGSPSRAVVSDTWTSMPLTLWITDFETRGYAMQEGEDRLIGAGIADGLMQESRIQLTERALLDKLLKELKLGTSKLADRATALSLGRILAARFILSGQIIHSGSHAQVSLRLIETETGLISVTVTEPFKSAVPTSALTEKLSGNLLNKLKKRYPLRGKISKAEKSEVWLNIGQKLGVATGQRFKVINDDVMLEIVSAEADKSIAKIIKGEKAVTDGQRVEVTDE